nr:uncharacterized protein LOC109429833 isoform X2 [Aedes albopictus]
MDTGAPAAADAAVTGEVYEENAASSENQSAAVDKMCRLCCSEGQADLSLLFPDGTSYEANKLLLKKIYECTTVQIANEGDDQNAMICEACIAKIDDFYSYREQCRANDDRIRQRAGHHTAVPEIHIKQEKDLQLEINITEPPPSLSAACEDGFQHHEDSSSHPRPTTATNEVHGGPEHDSVGKDEDSLLQPMGSKNRCPPDLNDELTIKREVIVDDDEVYYNSDGEAVSVPAHLKQNAESRKSFGIAGATTSVKKSNYRIIMTPTNRERLVYQGYLYCRHFSRRDGSVHWRCRLGGCQSAVNLNLDDTITPANNNKHSHPQNAPLEGEIEEEPSPLSTDNTALLESFGIHYGDDDQDLDDSSVNLSELTSVGEDSLRIVPNKKKGETLVHLGFKYCKRYVKMDGSTYWKCRSNNNKCTAGLYVYPEAKVRYHGTHNHDKVVGDESEYDVDSTMDDSLMQPFTIVEDVEDDEEGEEDYNDDMAALLTPSVEVMMDDRKQQGSADYEVTTNVKGRECLIYEGHQYSKDRERYDGAVLWRCRRNYDKCRAVAIIYADGRIEKSGEHRHETDKRYLERQEQGLGSRMFRITKNQRGNDALVFEGHRFSKEWSRVDGSIIWRCSYRSGMCRVKVVLNAEAYIHRMGTEHEHEHEQTEAPVTVEYSDEDVEVLDDSLLTPARSQPKLSLLPQIPQCPNFTTEQQMAGGYRIVKNRKGFEALVHDGYRYCKVRVRQDGSIKWLCKMNKKTCRAAVDLFPDGSIAKATEFDHNHERPNDMEIMDDDEEGDMPGQEITYPIDPEVFGNSQWYYVKNSKNGISMIHAGYRYTKKCERVDGTSLWRCSASQRGCKAGVILFPNDTLAMVENAEHSHKPSENVKPADYDQESEEMDRSQTDTVLGGDDVHWMGGTSSDAADNDQGNEAVWFNSSTDRPYPRPPNGQQADFRIIKNRRNTDSLVHRGYRYCKIRDRVDGSILWTCQMNKKTCKASVNLTVDGRVEVINAGHNHGKTDRDDGEDGDISHDQNVSYDISSDVDLTTDELQDEPEEPASPEPPFKHPDYYYSVNKSNNECLIHKGNRMSKRSERPDGTTTWRCSMSGNTCMAGVIIHPDGTPEENAIKHNHQPLAELPPEIERVVKPAPPPLPPVQPVISEPSTIGAYKRQGDSLEWNGFHYRKIKELPDGCIIWICLVDSCRVAVKMLPTGKLKMLSESEHNHTASGQPSSSAPAIKPAASTSSTEGRGRSYRLFKNQRGQMTLLYQGYRYSIRNRNQDGSSSWKCRSNSSCRAIIFLMPDDRIVPGNNNAGHNHEPNWESTKRLESVAPTRVNPLYDYLNIIPGGSNSRPPSSASKTQESSGAASSNVDLDQTPPNVNYGRNVVEHKNYFYRLIVRKKNGREYWRCVHFKCKSCRAALFCRDNGTIVTSTNGKEHNHKSGADARPLPSSQHHAVNKSTPQISLLEATRSTIQPSPLEEVQLTEGDEERYIDHGEYVIAKNRKDQNTLIYKDRRYYLSYNRSDGSAVWRCAHRKRYKCYAYVRLRPDGRLLSTGEQDHSHSMKTEFNPPTAETKPVKNYKIVKNRVGNDILIHENHRFRLNYQRNDGTTHWRCVWARSNHCSAGVYLFANGVLKNAANESAIVHNHPPPSQVRKATNVNAALEPTPGPSTVQPSFNATDKRTIPEDEGITDFKFIQEGSNKVLVCRGYRYFYTWVRKDGSIYYRCAEVKNLQCTMGILLLTNGKLVRAGDQCHNHDPSQIEEEEDNDVIAISTPAEVIQVPDEPQMEEEVIEQYAPLVIPQGGDSDFKIAKTSRGESLIYQGYRYWAKNRLANGIVSLCCTRKKMKKCPAMLRLLTNGRIMDPVGFGHTHPPNMDGGGDISMLQPVSVSVVPKQMIPKPAIIPKEPTFVVKTVVPASQLPALTFNEESEDDTEEGEEAILGSKRYTFVKSSAQRNFIVFEDFVYDFEHKQHDGCVFYRCKTSESCPATLMLLSNGRVMPMADSMHTHMKPDLRIFRPVGRGSKEFKIVQNKNGNNILVHRGHRYTTPRSKTDGAGIWYCHTYVSDMNRRCYVPIELLPNGRVAPVGDKKHNHNPPFKTKPEPGAAYDSKDNIVKPEHSNGTADSSKMTNNRMLLHGGHRYNFANKRDDGAILWKCIEKTCNASMYRLTDGHIVKGPEHNHDRMETLDNSMKRKLPNYDMKYKNPSPSMADSDTKLSSTPEPTSSYPRPGTAVKPNPYIGKPIIHEGYRYIYYLTRRDGSEHWRCSRRLPMKCRGGLFKQTDGTLIKSNDEGHSHPPYINMDDSVSMSCTITELSQESYDDSVEVEDGPEESYTGAEQQHQASFVDDEGSYDYELIDVKGKKRGMYLIHKGAMFVAGHTRRDRARYYRCRTAGCKVAMLLHRNGLLVRSNEHTHDCQNAVKTDEHEKEAEDEEEEEQEEDDHHIEPSNKKQRLENDEESLDPAEDVQATADEHLAANGDEDPVVEVKQEPADEH